MSKAKPETDWDAMKLIADQMYLDAIREGRHIEGERCDECLQRGNDVQKVGGMWLCRKCDPTGERI